MPKQEEHERPEDMVESPGLEEQAARSLEDAVDSHGTLEGYYAMNNEKPPKEVIEEIDSHRKSKAKNAQ